MELDGLNVLIDGINLELLQGTGIKIYCTSLIDALTRLGASPNVLISKYSLKPDREINTDVLALFQPLVKPWARYNYPLFFKTLLGMAEKTCSIPVPRDMIVTRGSPGFGYINDVGFFGSRGCYEIADMLHYVGLRVKVQTDPKMDIWHATYFTPIEVRGAARITTIHDLVPLRLPYATLNDKGIFVQQVRDAIKQSRLIICVSNHTRKDLQQFFHVPPEKMFVTYEPVMISDLDVDAEQLSRSLACYGLEYKNYILFVGAIEPKKNLPRLIKACLSLDTDMPLAVVGKKAWSWENELKMLGSDDLPPRQQKRIHTRVRLLDYVSGDDLPLLYKGAGCLVFPSLYEGFGLPPVEAMTLGCPVVTSTAASLPEICGDGALYADPYDTLDIAAKIHTALYDEDERARLIRAGYARADFFSMENYMKRLAEAYRKAL